MIDQLDLIPQDGEAHARHTDPETSHEAAAAVEGDVATKMEQAVVNALQLNPQGLTTHELVDFTGIPYESITPRMSPLCRKNLVCDSGERRRSNRKRKRMCIVWKAVGK